MSTWNEARQALAAMLQEQVGIPFVPNPPASIPPSATGYFRQIKIAPAAQGASAATLTIVVAVPHTNDAVFDELSRFVDGDQSITEAIDLNPTFGDNDEFQVSCDAEIEMESVEVSGIMCAAVGVSVELGW